MQAIPELRELGLEEQEIKVYLATLSGSASVKGIAQRAGIIRTTCYGILQSLMRKGLVSQVKKDGVMLFAAVPPRELLAILDQKRAKVQAVLPVLESLSRNAATPHKLEFFEGRNGVKAITNDLVSRPGEIVKCIGVGRSWLEFSRPFAAQYYRKKKERRVKTRTVLADTKTEREFSKHATNSALRYVPGLDVGNTATFIYHDKVSFVSYSDQDARGFIIEDKEFHRVMDILFEQYWREAKK